MNDLTALSGRIAIIKATQFSTVQQALHWAKSKAAMSAAIEELTAELKQVVLAAFSTRFGADKHPQIVADVLLAKDGTGAMEQFRFPEFIELIEGQADGAEVAIAPDVLEAARVWKPSFAIATVGGCRWTDQGWCDMVPNDEGEWVAKEPGVAADEISALCVELAERLSISLGLLQSHILTAADVKSLTCVQDIKVVLGDRYRRIEHGIIQPPSDLRRDTRYVIGEIDGELVIFYGSGESGVFVDTLIAPDHVASVSVPGVTRRVSPTGVRPLIDLLRSRLQNELEQFNRQNERVLRWLIPLVADKWGMAVGEPSTGSHSE